MTKELRKRLEDALAKPLAEQDCVSCDDFDPWADVLQGIDGCYSLACDLLFVEALKAVRDNSTFDFIKTSGLAGEMALYVLSGHGYTECGVSPRGGWWNHTLDGLLKPLIDKWEAHCRIQWGDAQSVYQTD